MRENHYAIFVSALKISYIYKVIVADENKNQLNISKYTLLQLFIMIY